MNIKIEDMKNYIGKQLWGVVEDTDELFDIVPYTVKQVTERECMDGGRDILVTMSKCKTGDFNAFGCHVDKNGVCSPLFSKYVNSVYFETFEEGKDEVRRRINNFVIEEHPVGAVRIFEGSFVGGLRPIDNDKLDWHEVVEEMGMRSITLSDIVRQVKDKKLVEYPKHVMLLVVVSEPLKGYIFQYGNSFDGNWYLHGKLKGYA